MLVAGDARPALGEDTPHTPSQSMTCGRPGTSRGRQMHSGLKVSLNSGLQTNRKETQKYYVERATMNLKRHFGIATDDVLASLRPAMRSPCGGQ